MGIKSGIQNVVDQTISWHEQGHQVELVTVASTFGSSPRPVGSMAAIRQDGQMVGSVSGGCIEKQLVERLRTANTERTERYIVTEEEAKRFGLMCGGSIELVFESVSDSSQLKELQQRLHNNVRTCRTLDLATGDVSLSEATAEQTFNFSETQLVNVIGGNHHVIIIGANDLARFTAEFALAVDFTVDVIEPRDEFRAAWNLPTVNVKPLMPDDAVRSLANHTNVAVLALTHDPNLDDLALLEALPKSLFYVGALGSKGSHLKRLKRLRGMDIPEHQLARIQAPIGLDIGSRTSAEIAISVVAELISQRYGFVALDCQV